MCAKSKPINRKVGFYTPLLVPSHPWESVSTDFVGGLPKSRKGHDYLYVVVDRFNEMCILIPCNKQITAKQTTKLFFEHVWFILDYLLPLYLIKTRDLWGSFGRVCGTDGHQTKEKHSFSSTN